MKKVYITGSSRGLGRALANCFLEEGAKVVGMSRESTISNENYEHYFIDLSDPIAVANFKFDLEDAAYEEVILINNAGSLGDIKHIGSLQPIDIAKTIQLNVSSPMMLANQFAATKCNTKCKKFVLNIGSGASKNAVDGWGVYCSSKAALNMFNEVFELENQKKDNNLLMRTLAPGIVDTQMQEEIRNSDSAHFFEKDRFVNYKLNNELATAEETAKKIMFNFVLIFKDKTPIQTIRNY